MNSEIRDMLLEERLIVIVRGVNKSSIEPLFEALYNSGVRFAEITMNTEDASYSIGLMREKYKDRMYIGAGTVLTMGSLQDALSAGAQFIVTPNTNPEVIESCVKNDVLVLPGAMTPTEIVSAINAGADMIKIFPAGTLGPVYVKELRGPFNNIKLFPVGGVSLENIPQFLASGAAGFGIGGSICNLELIAAGKFDRLQELAAQYVQAVKGIRN